MESGEVMGRGGEIRESGRGSGGKGKRDNEEWE